MIGTAYLQLPRKTRKAKQLVDSYGAEIVPKLLWADIPKGKAVIVVIENSDVSMVKETVGGGKVETEYAESFDAAGLAYSEEEYNALAGSDDPDDFRPRTYLLMDRVTAYRLAGFSDDEIPLGTTIQ